MATQRQWLAIYYTRAPAYAMHLLPVSSPHLSLPVELELEANTNQIFLGAQGQGACQSSPGLIVAPVNSSSRALGKRQTYVGLEAIAGRWRGVLRRLADINALEEV